MAKSRFVPSGEFLIGLLLSGALGWNLCCCLYSALAYRPLHFVTGANGGPFYLLVAAPWLTTRESGAPPWSGLWWSVVLLNLSVLGLLATGAALWYSSQRRQREEAERAERRAQREAAAAAASGAPPPPPGRKRIHLVSGERVGRAARHCWLCVAALALTASLLLLFGDPEFEGRAKVLYIGIVSLGPLAIWLAFRRAHDTTLLFEDDAVTYGRGRRRVWWVALSDIVGWYHERQGGASSRQGRASEPPLRAIVLRCADGSTRRIDAGWLGMPTAFYSEILDELKARTGLDDETPSKPDRPLTKRPPSSSVVNPRHAILIVAGLVAFAAIAWWLSRGL